MGKVVQRFDFDRNECQRLVLPGSGETAKASYPIRITARSTGIGDGSAHNTLT